MAENKLYSQDFGVKSWIFFIIDISILYCKEEVFLLSPWSRNIKILKIIGKYNNNNNYPNQYKDKNHRYNLLIYI